MSLCGDFVSFRYRLTGTFCGNVTHFSCLYISISVDILGLFAAIFHLFGVVCLWFSCNGHSSSVRRSSVLSSSSFFLCTCGCFLLMFLFFFPLEQFCVSTVSSWLPLSSHLGCFLLSFNMFILLPCLLITFMPLAFLPVLSHSTSLCCCLLVFSMSTTLILCLLGYFSTYFCQHVSLSAIFCRLGFWLPESLGPQ